MEYRHLYLLIPIALIGLFIWASVTLRRESIKDWATLEDLQDKLNEVETIEQLDAFEDEFCDKASKIFNKFIRPHLLEIKGTINGMRKTLR